MTTASDSAASRFREIARSRVADGTLPGVVALMARGDDVVVEAVGALSIDGPPIRRDSLFRIASTSKPISAAAALALADEGLLDLHEPVDRLLPELADRQVLRRMDGPLDDTVPAQRSITAHDLLTFTFGFGMVVEMFTSPTPWPIVAATDELALNTIGPPMPDVKPDPDTWIARFGSLPLLAQPGERWLYNTGTHVLGVLVERATGMPFADVLRNRIFEPLGMHDTAFFATDTSRLATSYVSTPDGLAVWDLPDGQWSHPPAFADGAAGLVSTADDLLAFARMLVRGGEPVLSADAARLMITDRLTPQQKAAGGLGREFFASSGWGYGLAVTTNGARAGSFGWDGGLGTSFLVDPARDLAVIVLTQRMFDTPDAPQWHRALQDAAYDALTGRPD